VQSEEKRDGEKQHGDQASVAVRPEETEARIGVVDVELAKLPRHMPAKGPDASEGHNELERVDTIDKCENDACPEEGN